MHADWLKPIPERDRLIFALDVPDGDSARRLIRVLGDEISFYKLGLELFVSGAYFELAADLRAAGKKVFADLKLFDIPPTIARTVSSLARHGPEFLTVHGQDAMLAAAADNKGDTKILAVTALTSLDAGDLVDLGFQCDVEALVLSRARRALQLGCDGVISSGLEVAALRAKADPALIVVCPGIRPVANMDEHKRTLDVAQAFTAGADYIVVGRTIRNAPDPAAAAAGIQQVISELFNNNN